MKNCIVNFLAIVLVFVLSFFNFVSAPVNADDAVSKSVSPEIITVANSEKSVPNADKVLESRFLNMLNHNFVYGDDIYSVESIVNNSIVALLDLRDAENQEYIAEVYVKDYVYNMYGVEIDDFSSINADFPQKDGFVYIKPMGFTVLEHEIISVTANEDGTYTVKTKISETYHDGAPYTDVCVTLFAPNEQSQFGFSIINSVIGNKPLSI